MWKGREGEAKEEKIEMEGEGGKIYVRRFKEWELKHCVLLLCLYLRWN